MSWLVAQKHIIAVVVYLLVTYYSSDSTILQVQFMFVCTSCMCTASIPSRCDGIQEVKQTSIPYLSKAAVWYVRLSSMCMHVAFPF